MFGMGIGEILIIVIIAVLFLGPDKLPSTLVDIAKFFRSVKGSVNSARATLEEEIKFSEIKQEALSYKDDLMNASSELKRITDMGEITSEISGMKNSLNLDITAPSIPSAPAAPKEPEVVTFTPKPKNSPEEIA